MARGNTQIYEVFRARSLTNSARDIFDRFPLGEGWYKVVIRLNLAITTGTATGPLADGLLRYILGLTLRSDRSEFFCNNIPGRPLFWFDMLNFGTAGLNQAVANGTQRAIIVIPFFDRLARFPEDTILDTSRYNTVTLELNAGSIANLYSTVGTGSVTATYDCYLVRQRGRVPQRIRPAFYPEYGVRAPVDGTATTEIGLERAANLGYKRILFHTGNTDGVTGQPFSATGSDAMATDVLLESDRGREYWPILEQVLQYENKQQYSLVAADIPPGLMVFDPMEDGSLMSGLYSGDRSLLRVLWTIGTAGTSPQWSVAYQGVRRLIGG